MDPNHVLKGIHDSTQENKVGFFYNQAALCHQGSSIIRLTDILFAKRQYLKVSSSASGFFFKNQKGKNDMFLLSNCTESNSNLAVKGGNWYLASVLQSWGATYHLPVPRLLLSNMVGPHRIPSQSQNNKGGSSLLRFSDGQALFLAASVSSLTVRISFWQVLLVLSS
ncbi:hypothetical protein L6452_05104 [Arctium lappa]|uniref:Uncharacterized protein n=1 Tax=Arctium lappa TaxID=4217 RepID=A0ACB9EG42_ARCLA|nr:hypothetical protein L6452_05104 [Arctium lappa]